MNRDISERFGEEGDSLAGSLDGASTFGWHSEDKFVRRCRQFHAARLFGRGFLPIGFIFIMRQAVLDQATKRSDLVL